MKFRIAMLNSPHAFLLEIKIHLDHSRHTKSSQLTNFEMGSAPRLSLGKHIISAAMLRDMMLSADLDGVIENETCPKNYGFEP